MTAYTPTTEQVRANWIADVAGTTPRRHAEAAFDRWLAAHDAEVRAEALAKVTDDGLWEEVLRLRGQIEEARTAWWSATEQGDNGLIYTDRIEDAMDDIWSAIGHVDWTPDHTIRSETGLCPPLEPGDDETCTHTPTCPTGEEQR